MNSGISFIEVLYSNMHEQKCDYVGLEALSNVNCVSNAVSCKEHGFILHIIQKICSYKF